MATLQSLSSTGPPIGHGKITKSRSRQAVKPILKKLQSHSEKNSLDLDRGWEDQAQYGYSSYKTGGDDISAAGGTYSSSFIPTSSHAPRSARDVSFSISATELGTGAPRSNKYNHARSTSGTSHASVATTTSGSRTGAFVHPFQQMPRTSTPPLSYATSLASLDNPTGPRDYSPTITEDDDDVEAQFWGTRNYPLPLSHPHPRPRRPSLASQRTSSLSDINQTLRATTNSRTSSGVATRIAPRIVTKSRSDLHLNTASSTALDSASSTSPPAGSFISPQMMAASSSSAAMSPLRSSMEANGFRLRSRSEADTSDRRDAVREARRKFDEKEKAKEEKYAREKIRKQERADHKEASRVNKSSHGRKSSFGHSRISCDRASSVTDFRPSFSRKNTGTALDEKLDFASRGYDTVPSGQTPHARADRVNFTSTKRNGTTKRKTSGTWTAFVLWLRTRLLRLGRQ